MKSVYTGGEKVADFESYDALRVGDGKSAFIYEGNELVYPNPVKDGLVLWYDFSGRTNTDGQRNIAEDLSGNGNHGTLQNFNYTAESGYDKNKLIFDGVDDRFVTEELDEKVFSMESVFLPNPEISSIDANFNSLNYSRSSGISLAINAARTSFIINYGVLGRTYVNIYFGKYEETKLILDKGVPVHTVVQIEPDTNIAYLYINGDFFASKELESEYNPNINKISGGN